MIDAFRSRGVTAEDAEDAEVLEFFSIVSASSASSAVDEYVFSLTIR